MKKGKLIVIEGSDSSGKATQTKILVNRLKEEGKKVISITFPQYSSFYGRMISKYLRGKYGNPHQINSYLVSLLYAQDRLLVKDKLINWLKQGKVVIADRYLTSNQIYQTAKISKNEEKEKFLGWLDKLEYSQNKLSRPDLVLYLHVPLSVVIKWKEKRVRQADHKFDVTYFKKVERQAKALTKKFKSWRMINCVEGKRVLFKKEVAEKIWGEVKKII
jgi:dTMP kinase